MAGVSFTIYPNVNNSENLQGWGFNIGASISGNGAELSGSIQNNGNNAQLGGAVGGGIGGEGHATVGYSFLVTTITWQELLGKNLSQVAEDAGINPQKLKSIINDLQNKLAALAPTDSGTPPGPSVFPDGINFSQTYNPNNKSKTPAPKTPAPKTPAPKTPATRTPTPPKKKQGTQNDIDKNNGKTIATQSGNVRSVSGCW